MFDKLSGIFREWKKHTGSLAISLVVTLAALAVYYFVFIGEARTPLADFITRLELDSLDTRFRLRGRVHPDSRIVIVDIDQRSQEALGQWPFPRIYFAKMLDALHDDGASVVAFDITFSKPDATSLPLRTLLEGLSKGQTASADVQQKIAELEKQYDYDQQLADAIKRFGKVVLGNYFLYTSADLQGVSPEALDRYANLISFFPFPQVRALPSAGGSAGYVRLIQNFDDLALLPKGAEANTETFTAALSGDKAGCGFFNIVGDPDGVVRRSLLALPYGRDPNRANWDLYASLEVQTLRLYLNLPNEKTVLNFGGAGIASIEFGPDLVVHPDDVGRMMINYQGPPRTYPYVSFADVVQHRFSAGEFRDKIVLVGASATGIGDLRATPFGGVDFPGVEIHANVIDDILNRHFLRRGPHEALTDVVVIFLFGIPLGIWLALVRPRWLIFGFLLLIPFAWFVYSAFLHDQWLNFIAPAAFTLAPNVSLVALYRVLVEEREKRHVRGAFQQYVSPEVIRRLLVNPGIVQPRKTEISVLFSDVRGFTSISEQLDAQELAALLNSYLTEMTRIIFKNRGTLDKYIGDAVMAFWGAPFDEARHAERSCRAALDMMAKLRELQAGWKAAGRPVLEIGIGINSGIASVGNMGSQLRYGYTAMGDSVNLASRLEGLNKDFGTRILLSEFTFAQIADAKFVARELDLIRVKGKLQPVKIYELLGDDASAAEFAEMAAEFWKARVAYADRNWREALRCFETFLKRWPDDGPAKVFLERCKEHLAEEPPPDWDGVYEMQHK
ncbi:MAG: adenylate/guanylate cyclase domain-containing protein [Candidatus Acidiferrales bacterium]